MSASSSGARSLGAGANLGCSACQVKGLEHRLFANCTLSVNLRMGLQMVHEALVRPRGSRDFAEPGALSSTSPADSPLPRTASRRGFVLVASRARRTGDSTGAGRLRSRADGTLFVQFAAAGGRRAGTVPWRVAGGRGQSPGGDSPLAPGTVPRDASYAPASVGRSYWPSCCSSIRSSSSSVPMRTGPSNHLLAESTHQPPKSSRAPPTVSGA